MFFLSTWTSCRPRRKMRGRNGTQRTARAKGRNVALALAPRTCFLKVALPLRRGAHFSLANLSGAWGPSGASWGPLGPPEASCGLLGPPGTSCGLLGPHPYSLLIYTPAPLGQHGSTRESDKPPLFAHSRLRILIKSL